MKAIRRVHYTAIAAVLGGAAWATPQAPQASPLDPAVDAAVDAAPATKRLNALLRVQSGASEAAGDDPIRETIERLRVTNQLGRITILGEAAGPYLREWAEGCERAALLSRGDDNPLKYFAKTAPLSALEYYSDLEANDPDRFLLVLRTNYSFRSLIDSDLMTGDTQGKKLEAGVRDLIDRTVSRSSIPVENRVSVASLALWHGLDSEAVKATLRRNVDLAVAQWSDIVPLLAPLVIDMDPLPSEAITDAILAWTLETGPGVVPDSKLTSIIESAARAEVQAGSKELIQQWKNLGKQWAGDSSFDPGSVERIVHAAVNHANESIARAWAGKRLSFATVNQALAAWRGVAGAKKEIGDLVRDRILGWIKDTELPRGERSTAVLELLMSSPGSSETVLEALAFTVGASRDDVWRGRIHRDRVLTALPSSQVSRAIEWLSSPDAALHDRRFANAAGWVSAAPELRAVLNDGSRSQGEWLLAAASLLTSGKSTAADRAQIVAWLTELAADPDTAAATAASLSGIVQGSNGQSALHWTEIGAALVADERVPDGFADVLPMLVEGKSKAEREVAVRFLDAAEARWQRHPSTLNFRNAEYYGIKAAARSSTFFRKGLLTSWITRQSITNELIQAVSESGDSELIDGMRQQLVSSIRSTHFAPSKNQLASMLLMLPGRESVEALISVAIASDSASFTEYVDTRVARLMRLKTAAAQWSNEAGGGGSRAQAISKVAALLNSPNKDIRVEAIHGLGTLGAVELLPTLIPLVASDDAEIRAAARATLKRLRDADKEEAPEGTSEEDKR